MEGPQPGELIPPFIARAVDGRAIRRHDYKGRRHLVLFFAHDAGCAACRAALAALAAAYPALREEGGEVLAFLPVAAGAAGAAEALPYQVVVGEAGELHGRYGARSATGEPLPALFVADRYGEVVLRAIGRVGAADGAPRHGLPLDEVLPTLALLQVRCSL